MTRPSISDMEKFLDDMDVPWAKRKLAKSVAAVIKLRVLQYLPTSMSLVDFLLFPLWSNMSLFSVYI